jgi:hypothetical protein
LAICRAQSLSRGRLRLDELVVPSLDLFLDHLGHQNGMLAITFPAWETQASDAVRGHPSKKVALEFIQLYAAKYGAGIYFQLAATVWGSKLQLDKAIPLALKQAKPGIREFRLALMQNLETMGETGVPQGVLRDSAKHDHGYAGRARFVSTAKDGNWQTANGKRHLDRGIWLGIQLIDIPTARVYLLS